MESNHLPSGYEPPALTDELQPRFGHYTAVVSVMARVESVIILKEQAISFIPMQKINVRKLLYAIRHKYLTFNNLVILTAFLIAVGWVWGSLQVMQRNYGLQKEVDYKKRELQLAELQRDSLELQKRYYETDEYKELAARESLGLVMPGESVLILPDKSEAVKQADAKGSGLGATTVNRDRTSNLEQWLNFLFGGYSKSINSSDDSDT